MVRCNAINEADKELYKYALYSFFLLVSPLILAGGVGFGLGSVKHGVALIFPFMVEVGNSYSYCVCEPDYI